MTNELVRVQKVGTEIEAEVLCAALRSGGVRCNYAVSLWHDPMSWNDPVDQRGPYDVYVDRAAFERANAILDDADVQGERFALEPLSVDDLPEPSNAGRAATIVFWLFVSVVAIPLAALIVLIVRELTDA